MTFRIVETPGNKSGSIPAHWEIHTDYPDGSENTIWSSEARARFIARCLEVQADIEAFFAQQDRFNAWIASGGKC